jgi:hypothetical protein
LAARQLNRGHFGVFSRNNGNLSADSGLLTGYHPEPGFPPEPARSNAGVLKKSGSAMQNFTKIRSPIRMQTAVPLYPPTLTLHSFDPAAHFTFSDNRFSAFSTLTQFSLPYPKSTLLVHKTSKISHGIVKTRLYLFF